MLTLATTTCLQAGVIRTTVLGTDAIFLAGRTDITIPDPSLPWGGPAGLTRHGGPTPEEAKETRPPMISVAGADVIRLLDPAVGGVNFFNGSAGGLFGPSGNGAAGSSLTSLGAISGYKGPQGPLTGVFLDAGIPSTGLPPATLDFTPGGIGIDFATLSPLLNQIFYIGDGVTAGGDFQTFIAPTGATRLFLGIPDGFGFGGAPGAYDDNDGSYEVVLGINQIPTTGQVPEPSSMALALGLIVMGSFGRRRSGNHHVK